LFSCFGSEELPKTASDLARLARIQAEQLGQMDIFAALKNRDVRIAPPSSTKKAPAPEQSRFSFFSREDRRIVRRGGKRTLALRQNDLRRELDAAYVPQTGIS
jgi:hypothetical protein